ncbi:hypothetical protein CYMTET_51182 [Cymbomonas tetramitiformis]|uniref:Cyanobacterial aminoacyl-tRNA synthetase CAAD domain-containing protein n=1 Tax=Cymbomonas tetramitiformis TaxID=36881 RepID=A0AAE0BNJ6_9CHLO|nr:hypothetical protein CYMTET_51182 [Cymbomonas tetramitiformis]
MAAMSQVCVCQGRVTAPHCGLRKAAPGSPKPFSLRTPRGLGVCVPLSIRTGARYPMRVRAAEEAEAAPKAAPKKEVTTDIPEIMTETYDKVKGAWVESDQKPAIVSLGVSFFVFLVSSAGVLKAIDSVPILPFFFEVVGIAYSAWFGYRYLLFQPDREELKVEITQLKGKILDFHIQHG